MSDNGGLGERHEKRPFSPTQREESPCLARAFANVGMNISVLQENQVHQGFGGREAEYIVSKGA